VTVRRRVVYPIPDSLDFVSAALLEPLTIALHATKLGGAGPATRSAVVVGAGTIGLAMVAALAAKGVARIAAGGSRRPPAAARSCSWAMSRR
jgi:threonine dehydrogenase-like Zn-dependent dehydrogenase